MKYVLSVSEINKYIKEVISRDLILSNLWVKGEISNYKYHYSGHMYFTIKDETSVLKCVMFKSHASLLRFQPENGMKVMIKGYVSVFERDGQYQLYAEEMQPDGIGALHLAYEQLKNRLEKEGLFDARYKKRIPYLPQSIGVVTSSTGAVIRDILNVLNRRFSNFQLKLYPVAVQGELAARQIAKAIKRLNEEKNVDVIIVARGGGSLEELWAFNEEIVARSIFESEIPVISAVGHETDFTIADFVADLRAPTPSAAAELVLPEKVALRNGLESLRIRLRNSLIKTLDMNRARLKRVQNSTVFRQPYDRVYQERMQLDVLNKYLIRSLKVRSEKERANLAMLVGKLDALSPLTVLARGYSIIKSKGTGNIVKTVENVKLGDQLELSVSDGRISCSVSSVEKGKVYGQR
ncbi:MAG: exodeoxyribonuclease VII large subunit [Clostridia bacterium]|nr:exodeoxyribonuclease VII large subunit [Clostridia bacterium]